MENGASTGPSLDRHLNFTERIEERHILASRRVLANNKAGGAQIRPPRTPGCKHKLAGIGRLLVSCASQARMHTTHDPRHEKVADRRGSSHGVRGLHVFAFGCVLPAGGSHGATSLVFSNSTLTIEFENRMQDSDCNRCMHKKQCEAN